MTHCDGMKAAPPEQHQLKLMVQDHLHRAHARSAHRPGASAATSDGPTPIEPTGLGVAVLAAPSETTVTELAVGFVDVCDFTTLSRFVDLPHLEHLLQSFDGVCAGALGDRAEIVKPVGDGVLYAMATADDAVAAAVRIVAAARGSSLLPPVRVGLAFGSVLVRRADCFGPVVNLASRLVAEASPGAVVVADEARHETLERGWSWRRLPRRELKGVGSVAAWEVTGAPSAHARLR